MAELEAPELTRAEQKIKDEELTPAELATFGILPPEPDKPEPVKGHEPGSPNCQPDPQHREDPTMKPSTEDKAEGKLHEVKGKIKEQIGKSTNNPDLEESGHAEKTAGKVQKWIGNAEKAVGE